MTAPASRVRYRITHTSLYGYDHAVTASYNEARLTPRVTPWQTPLESSLSADPATWQHRYVDYWGTQVRTFEANATHRELTVRATSLVEVDASRRAPGEAVTWDDVRSSAVQDACCEFLAQTPLTEVPAELAALAEATAARLAPSEAGREISAAVHGALTYLPGSTHVRSSAAEAWTARSGVCQDYAHLVVGALRHVGLPARYVSGYLHPAAAPVIGEATAGESHAWVEWWQGEWAAFDPTNLVEVGNRHVMVGAGRDYGDIPPIKGIVAGDHSSTDLDVRVELTRMA
jgi:transglutaminase-like putative cysteine protease